jgi:plasmid stability protein
MANISIKNVPEPLLERLRARAARNHRSLQGELMAIIEAAENATAYASLPTVGLEVREPLTADQIWERARARGIESASESARLVREDRDR